MITINNIPLLYYLVIFYIHDFFSLSIAIETPANPSGLSSSMVDTPVCRNALLYPQPFSSSESVRKHGNGNNGDCECFNCGLEQYRCHNYAECHKGTGLCQCPIGFGGSDCLKPLCGSLADGMKRNPLPDGQQKCQCTDGWTGINCNVCVNDNACNPLVNPNGDPSINATCNKNAILVNHFYHECSIQNKALLALLGNMYASASFQCGRNSDITEVENNLASCQFEFWVDYRESFVCHFENCTQERAQYPTFNQTMGTCKNVSCECIPGRFLCGQSGSIDISELLVEAKGPATFTCRNPGFDDDRYNCEFDEPEFRENLGPVLGPKNPVIELKCESGECLDSRIVPSFDDVHQEPSYLTMFALIGGSLTAMIVIGFASYVMVIKYKKTQTYHAAENQDVVNDELERLISFEHHVPVSVSFHNLRYEITKDGQKTRILNGINGIVKPGEVMAIMGASGAGKSTCLDILAGKQKRGFVSGQLLVNGKVPTRSQFRKISGYVDQEDTLLGTLTVYETLLNSALLRLPKEMSRAAKEKRVQDTMVELGIEHIANRRIGYPGYRGISGGEKRRVSIASEVVTNPSILYLDEPTSGLDSFNALAVVQSLITLAKKYNRTIILSIHQPRSNIFAMFDKLLLLGEDGYMCYSGPIYQSHVRPTAGPSSSNVSAVEEELVLQNWLKSIGMGCPTGFNMADYLIDLTKTGTSLASEARQIKSSNNSKMEDIHWDNDDKNSVSLSTIRSSSSSPSISSTRNQNRKFFIPIDDVDLQYLQEKRPHLYPLVVGFLTSKICSNLAHELDSNGHACSLSSPIPSVNALSPNIVEEFSNEITSDQQPLLSGGDQTNDELPSYEESTLIETVRKRYLDVYHSIFPNGRSGTGYDTVKPGSWTQFKILSGRSFVNIYRNPALMLSHYVISIILAVALGGLFWQLGLDIPGFQNRMGFFTFVFLEYALTCMSSLETFAFERLVFMRERANGYYGVAPYFFSKVLFDIIPLRLGPSLLIGCISYYMVGLSPDITAFLKFLLASTLFHLTAAAQCFVIGILFGHNRSMSNLVAVQVVLYNLLLGGFLFNLDKTQGHVKYLLAIMQYGSNVKFALEAVLVNEVADLTLKDRRYGADITVPGSIILDTFGFRATNYWPDVTALTAMLVFYLTFALLFLVLLVRERR